MKKFLLIACLLFTNTVVAYKALENKIIKETRVFLALKKEFDSYNKWLEYACTRKQIISHEYRSIVYQGANSVGNANQKKILKTMNTLQSELKELTDYIESEEPHVLSLLSSVQVQENNVWVLRQRLLRYRKNLKKFLDQPRKSRWVSEKRDPRNIAPKQKERLLWLDLAH